MQTLTDLIENIHVSRRVKISKKGFFKWLNISYLDTIEKSEFRHPNAIHAWNRFSTSLGMEI